MGFNSGFKGLNVTYTEQDAKDIPWNRRRESNRKLGKIVYRGPPWYLLVTK